MDYEIFMVAAAGLLFFLDLVLLSASKRGGKRATSINLVVAVAGFALILASYFLLLRAFVTNDFQFVSVYSYSSSSLPLMSKVYASFGGAGGSMLFLTVLLSVVYFALRTLTFKKLDDFNVSTSQVFSFVLLIFVLVTLVMNPFERFVTTPVEGSGLNPQLQTFWMAIHPPIVFGAYVFVVLAYAFTLASIKTNRELESSRLFTVSTYAGWMLLTLGIALGGVWAYGVLGWGGYWAWDPVETASLVPWLLLTAYVIVRAVSKSRTSFAREFMIMTAFTSLVFLSALTRGGFTSSVHSYAVSAVGPIMLVFAVGMIGYFFYLQRSKRKPVFKLEVDKTSLTSRSSFLGFWALILISIVCLVGLAFSNFLYNYWTFPFVLLFVGALIGFSLDDKTSYVRVLLIFLIALGVGFAVLLTGILSVNPLLTVTSPLLVVAFLTALFSVSKAGRKKSSQRFGQALLSLAIIVLLIGVFTSAGAKSTVTVGDLNPNVPTEEIHATIILRNLTISNSSTLAYDEQTGSVGPEYSTLQADVIVQQEVGQFYQGTVSASYYPNYGLVLRPMIITTAMGDLYVHLELSEAVYDALLQTLNGNTSLPETVSITVQTNPLVYLVWTGVGLMLAAMLVQFGVELKKKPEA